MSDVIISVRIPRELKEEIKKHEIRVSDVVRRALEEEIRRRKMEKLREVAGELGRFFARIPNEKIVGGIREFRERG